MSEIGSGCASLQSNEVPRIDHIEEIMINILTRLPAKTIGVCKSVCKNWLRLISEPQFPVLHLSHSRKKPKYIICPYSIDTHEITHLSIMEEDGEISQNIPLPNIGRISSSDLVCFRNGLIFSFEKDFNDWTISTLRIFNPITRDVVVLPQGTQTTSVPWVVATFDENNNFKVFRFFDLTEEDFKYKCEVFASGSTSWRTILEGVDPLTRHACHQRCPYYVSIDGCLYWFAYPRHSPINPLHIVSADMNNRFTIIDLPIRLLPSSFLIEFEGCLSIVHVAAHHQPPYVEVFQYINRTWWLRTWGILEARDVFYFNSVAARENEIFFIIKLRDDSYWYVIFNADERTFHTLDLHNNFEGYFPIAFPYVESLLKCSEA